MDNFTKIFSLGIVLWGLGTQIQAHACTHIYRSCGLSWTIPNVLRIENRDTHAWIIENRTIHPGESYTFSATDGALHVIYGKNRYVLSYPTCANSSGTCLGGKTTYTITSMQIKKAIQELGTEQKEDCFLNTSTHFILTKEKPIDELSITNDTPFPVKISKQTQETTGESDEESVSCQQVAPGQSFHTIIPTQQDGKPYAHKKKQTPETETIIINDALGSEHTYTISVAPGNTQTATKTNRSLQTSTITQAVIALSTLQKIKADIRLHQVENS